MERTAGLYAFAGMLTGGNFDAPITNAVDLISRFDDAASALVYRVGSALHEPVETAAVCLAAAWIRHGPTEQ